MHPLTKVLCFYGIFSVSGQYYEFPDVLIEPLSPKGLRVSIPDEDGIQLFAFHGKINSPMNGREAGIFSEDIRGAENGRWTFFAKNARLKPGDKLYYWIHVRYDGSGYEKDGEPFTVSGDGSVSSTTTTTTSTTTTRPLCVRGETKLNGKTACKGMLIFHETFSRLDKTKWKPEVKFPQVPVSYTDTNLVPLDRCLSRVSSRVEARIVVKVDGVAFGTVYPPAGGFAIDHNIIQVDPAVADRWRKGTVLAPFDQEMYVVLGVGAAGMAFPDSMADKPWENGDPKAPLYFYRNQTTWKQTWGDNSVLEVDYVKVWAL